MSREEEPVLSRARLAVLSATLATAVGLGTFPSFAFGVLAPFLRDEFGLSRSKLGLLTTLFFVVGAPASLAAGRVVDVGMLAIVTEVHGGQTGRASVMIVFGFFCGCIVSPLLFGYSVDETGSYAPGWLGVLTVFWLAGLIAIRWRRAWIKEAAP